MLFRFSLLFLMCFSFSLYPATADSLMKKGWAALVMDKDLEAISCFELAYEQAVKKNDTKTIAESLLNLGICYYGVSGHKGLEYCVAAMACYKKLENSDPETAIRGRCRCLQLASTIYSRQGKYHKALALSREALVGFSENDNSGYLGLAYVSIGAAFAKLGLNDSSDIYYRKALKAQLRCGNLSYLPTAYVYVADLERKKQNASESKVLYARALKLADSTGNQQAQVTALIGIANWQKDFGSLAEANQQLAKARNIAALLRDRIFYLKVLEELLRLRKQEGKLDEAFIFNDEIIRVKDSISANDQQRLAKSLEVQFNLAEKDRKLQLLEQEKNIALLSNYLLWATIVFILVLSAAIIAFLKRNHSRDKLLLQTKEKLMAALEEQKHITEKYLKNEIEFKESQMSAMALQILQKNELMQELKQQLQQNEKLPEHQGFEKIINKGLNHEKEWTDFNAYFESINKNFYERILLAYPDISPNDLKICALIKLNLSIKEMAGVLNISPDSVKTARYRLRKKLLLATEENLADFILKL